MRRLNKKLALTMLSLGFAALTPNVASADNFARNFDPCNPCNPCVETCKTDCNTNSCCSFDVGVDFLYWKPCVDDLDFAANISGVFAGVDGTDLDINYKSVCPQWEPGFRIFLKKEDAWKCFDLSFSYTWLDSNDSHSSSSDNGEFIAPVGLHPSLVELSPQANNFYDSARGKWSLDYQVFDILLSYPFRCGSCHTIAPFFGVEIAKLDQEFETAYELAPIGTDVFATVAETEWNSDYKGAGLKIGTDYKYVLCEGLSLFARASGTILVGDSRSDSEQAFFNVNTTTGALTNEVYFDFEDDDCCHFVPGCHLQLGFEYEDESCGCEFKLRVGYEMVKWCNMQNPRRWFGSDDVFDGNIAQSTQSNTSTLGFHGLLVGLEVKF